MKETQPSKLTRNDSVTDTPWITALPEIPSLAREYTTPSNRTPTVYDGVMERGMPEPTTAPFSPNQQTISAKRNPSSVLIHQKSPLLVATPPQVTRALAYSHPFILPLNYLAGLTSWTSGDPWESTLLVFGFWFLVLYGDYFARVAGPIVLIGILIAGMYARKYSPLSSAAWDKNGRQRAGSDSQQRKSLDEILETLQTFTTRCELMLDPLIRMTEFLSTQDSATSQTARPTLTSMFTRILAITPIWILLTLPPLRIITTRRLVLVIGTTLLTWHSEQARATRAILWRSRSVRHFCSTLTGLRYIGADKRSSLILSSQAAVKRILSSGGGSGSDGPANPEIRFTFALFENQRRWIALGYLGTLLPADRDPWTDDQLEATPEKERFFLPDTDIETSKWRWVAGSEWKIDTKWSDDPTPTKTPDKNGWTYYDNKWHSPSRADDWGKWTRRRRWIRDAELVELTPEELAEQREQAALYEARIQAMHQRQLSSDSGSSPRRSDQLSSPATGRPSLAPTDATTVRPATAVDNSDAASVMTVSKRKGWFGRRRAPSESRRAAVNASDVPSAPPVPSPPGTSGYESADHGARETPWDANGTEGLAF